jgi:cell shape-determining protein MreC
MTYLQTSKRSKSFFSNKPLVSISVVVVLVILFQLIFSSFLPGIFTAIAKPFWRVQFVISTGELSPVQTLQIQNEELKRNLLEVLARSNTVGNVMKENAELKDLLKRVNTKYINANAASSSKLVNDSTMSATSSASSTAISIDSVLLKPSPYILAAVLKRPPLALYDELILDIGENQGVAVDNLVYAPGNIIVGRISEVLSETSKAVLLSSPGATYDVLIGGSKSPAVSKGQGGGLMSAQVPRDSVAAVGDIVSVPSIDNKVIGQVIAINKDSTQPFETILFTSLSNIYDMRWALVDTKAAQIQKSTKK